MATTSHGIGTPPVTSPRSKGRDARSAIPCRNLSQYGYCRNEKDGCMFSHDAPKLRNGNSLKPESAGPRALNVESPAFKPGIPNGSTVAPAPASKVFSPKAASAAAFVPRNSKAGFPQSPPSYRPPSHNSPGWRNRDIPEFVPQAFNPQQVSDEHQPTLADPFNPYADHQTFNGLEATPPSQQLNPYGNDPASSTTLPFYQQQSHLAPLQHHLYANVGPRREDLQPYQRTAHDFFISEDLRQEFQRKADTTLQTLPNSGLPARVDDFHSLVPLDTNTQKPSQTYGWKTWMYKATRSRDGATCALRRIEGFRLSHERMVAPIRAWERLENASITNVRGCFTTREFGDSSLVVFTDYHPTAKTLAEHHFTYGGNQRGRAYNALVPEQILWAYIVQLANAIKVIHAHGLAARCIGPTKVILTGKNRIRLTGLGILDVVDINNIRPLAQLQEEDMRRLGQLMLALATNTANPLPTSKALDTLSRTYSPRLKACITSLLEHPPPIDAFITSIADEALNTMNGALNQDDGLTSTLTGELENGRLVRLITKLGFINERQEYNSHNPEAAQWSETGERYYLKLFRDYVFHQVSSDGRPVLDLGHVIACLNKLDAGSEEKIALTTRDEQYVFVVSYKEIKRGVASAFDELARVQKRS